MIQGAVTAKSTAAAAPKAPDTTTASRPIARRASRPAPSRCAVWMEAACRTA